MRKKLIGVTNENGKPSRSILYQRGNYRDGSPHYVFLYSDDDDDDDDDDDAGDKVCDGQIPLQLRTNKQNKNINPRKVEVITVTLKPEDTLQALSLRYRCTISELKRINNIHKDNEIFARRIIKVPVAPFSILTEINKDNTEEEKRSITTEAPEIMHSIVTDYKNYEEQRDLIPLPSTSININNSNNDDINNIILNSLSIESLKSDTSDNDFAVNGNENDLSLIDDRNLTSDARVIELFGCSGADWGLTWIHLLAASLLFGFVLPVFYIIFITESEDKHFNSTNDS